MTSRNAYVTGRFSVPDSAGPLLPLGQTCMQDAMRVHASTSIPGSGWIPAAKFILVHFEVKNKLILGIKHIYLNRVGKNHDLKK